MYLKYLNILNMDVFRNFNKQLPLILLLVIIIIASIVYFSIYNIDFDDNNKKLIKVVTVEAYRHYNN